jgi:hypothetical protein
MKSVESCGGKLPLSVISRSSRDGYVHIQTGKDGWESRDTVGQKEFRVERAETLWDKRRSLELGEQRHCGTKGV